MSSKSIEFEEAKSKGRSVDVYCAQCCRRNSHLVLQSIEESGWEFFDEYKCFGVSWRDSYQIVQCEGCKNVTFRHESWFSEEDDSLTKGVTERLYPQRSEHTITPKEFRSVPDSLRRIYRETIDAFNYKAVTLCAGGLRALVEGLCAEQGVIDGPVESTKADGATCIKQRKNLQGKIAGLHQKGIMTKQSSDILHEHRFLGNEALHELQQPSPNELKLAIEILEHTLDSLYEIPRKADELRKSKIQRTGN